MPNNVLLIALSLVTLLLVLGIGMWQYRSVRRKQENLGESSQAVTHEFATHDHPTQDVGARDRAP